MIGEKLIQKAIELGIPLISKFVKDKDLAAKMEQEWRILLQTNSAELEKLALEVERDNEAQLQATIREELKQSDLYTKRTRPMLARRSGLLSVGYIAFCLYTQITATPDILIDWAILMVLASPILTYMGVRSFDKWRHPS